MTRNFFLGVLYLYQPNATCVKISVFDNRGKKLSRLYKVGNCKIELQMVYEKMVNIIRYDSSVSIIQYDSSV